MTEIEFLKAAYLLLKCLPVSDVRLSFSEDVCYDVITAKLNGSLTVQHFKKLADTDLIITLDEPTYSLTINHPFYHPF